VPDVHAGDIETATVHRYYPGLADIEIAQTLPPVSLGEDRIMTWLFGGHTAELSPNGYLGAPADFGTVDIEAMMHDVAARLAEAFLSHRTESQIS
jgi:creatinine amidohydrolase